MATKEEVLTALEEVEDPELDISIVELGLVYDVRFEDKDGVQHAEVDMTLTSPGCPAAAARCKCLMARSILPSFSKTAAR